MKTLLITGTDTAVGKTWITSLLLRKLGAAGLAIGGYKPVCSGCEQSQENGVFWSDVELLRNAGSVIVDQDIVCPQQFLAPLAPPLAASLEERAVDETLLLTGLDRWRPYADYVIVEGAGGLLCPISQSLTVADLASQLNSPLVIVAANRLGVINHTLLTVQTAVARGLDVAAIILNDVANSDSKDESPANAANSGTHQASEWPDARAWSNAADTNPQLLQQWCPQFPLFLCQHLGQTLIPLSDSARAVDWAGLFR